MIKVLHVLLVLFKWEFLEPTLKQHQLFCALLDGFLGEADGFSETHYYRNFSRRLMRLSLFGVLCIEINEIKYNNQNIYYYV